MASPSLPGYLDSLNSPAVIATPHSFEPTEEMLQLLDGLEPLVDRGFITVHPTRLTGSQIEKSKTEAKENEKQKFLKIFEDFALFGKRPEQTFMIKFITDLTTCADFDTKSLRNNEIIRLAQLAGYSLKLNNRGIIAFLTEMPHPDKKFV